MSEAGITASCSISVVRYSTTTPPPEAHHQNLFRMVSTSTSVTWDQCIDTLREFHRGVLEYFSDASQEVVVVVAQQQVESLPREGAEDQEDQEEEEGERSWSPPKKVTRSE